MEIGPLQGGGSFAAALPFRVNDLLNGALVQVVHGLFFFYAQEGFGQIEAVRQPSFFLRHFSKERAAQGRAVDEQRSDVLDVHEMVDRLLIGDRRFQLADAFLVDERGGHALDRERKELVRVLQEHFDPLVQGQCLGKVFEKDVAGPGLAADEVDRHLLFVLGYRELPLRRHPIAPLLLFRRHPRQLEGNALALVHGQEALLVDGLDRKSVV